MCNGVKMFFFFSGQFLGSLSNNIGDSYENII